MAGSGKELGALEQIEAVPLESSKLRLTMQAEEPGDVVPFGTSAVMVGFRVMHLRDKVSLSAREHALASLSSSSS